ncbi:transcriptional regulator ATRX homolog isoform X2 [Ochlerotatus camptorhynchus]|uniref:transcriptional regulator ATRX homolog isoform X2 n=1 Tax=Ochlerotatus camptorhynchus TaxID=644619 RepID=UPI0031D9D6A4
MGAKRKSTIRTRSQRQVRITQAKKDLSSDEEDRGVTPTPPPTNTGKVRRRALRKRLQVLASSVDDTVSEDGKTTTNGGSVESGDKDDDSDSTTDDPIERMKATDRLPLMIMEVRKMSEEIAMVCDALEQALISDASDQDLELESLKKKLTNLTERCYHKVVPVAAIAPVTAKIKTRKNKLADRASRIRKEAVAPDDIQSTPMKRVDRSSSVDYTEYVSPEGKVAESAPADESTKDSGNPSSGHDESVTMIKATEELPTYVELDCCSPTPVFNEYEPESIREVQGDVTGEPFVDLNPDSVEGLVANDDSENFYDPSLFKESDIEEGALKIQESSASDKADDPVINDDIFNMHSYATPNNRESVRPVAPRFSLHDISNETAKLQKQQSNDTPVGMETRRTGHRRLITDAEPNFSTPSTATEEKPVNIEPETEPYILYQPSEPTSTQIKDKPDLDTLYQAEPSTSKDSNVQLISMNDGSSKSKFVTNTDPNPNREPTNEEIRYIVPHLPKFSVTQTPQGENYELSLMKRDIEMRLRVNDLSWVTQRAIRNETTRMKEIVRSNKRLELEMKRFGDVLSANQLILDYDAKKKTFIRVHPELVAKMKPHQKEGIKFMYDCCYGGSLGSQSAGSGSILAHCMGLGKTMQVIALMNTVICYPQLNTKRIIVVCPKSTVMNWVQEIRHWLGDIQSDVSVQIFYLPDNSNIYKKMEVLRGFHNVTGKNAHCLLIGYEAFRALVFYDAKNKNGEQHSERVRTEVRRILINPGPDLMVLDEGHIIKNRKSQTNLSVSEVATKRRIILTGTPIQNNLNEYFCMVSFVKPAYLGNEREFNENYAKPIKDGQHKDSNVADIRFMKMKSFILHKHLASFVQRKEFSVLEGFLPEKFEYVLYVPLTPVQEDLYEQYLKRNPFRKDVGGRNLLEDYTFMRKIWTHPIVLERAWENAMKKKYGIKEKRRAARRVRGFDSSSEDDDDNDADNARSITNVWWKQMISKDDFESLFPSNKMLLLFEILRMCQEHGEKCLIFSGFVMVLNMVEHFMKMIDEQSKNPKAQLYGFSRFRGPWRPGMDYYRLDGGTSKSIRHEMITKFNDPKNRVTRVFLISTKAGGQGINLVGANRVVILDTSWNPAVDQQGIFRIYRLGQQKSCYIYRLLAIHTMEEKVYSRAVTKQAMSHRVADKKQVDRNYNMAELEELYHFERVNMSARPISAPAVDDVLSTLLLKFPKLIFRYHTHETMLDNKTEQDLTDIEKELAWTEFKKKALTINMDFGIGDDQGGDLGKTDSQLSEMDVDSELQNMFEKSCVPKCEVPEPDPFDINKTPLAIPVRPSFGKKFNEKLLDVDPEPVEDEGAIFGEDPYNELSVGGSIIEEQRKKLSIKQESDTQTSSQVTVSEDEIGLLRTLEEESGSAIEPVQIKQKPLGYIAQDVFRDAPVIDSIEMLDLSYEGADEVLEPAEPMLSVEEPELTEPSTSVDVSTDTLSSMIEYDPISSSQDNGTCASTIYHSDLSETIPIDGSVTDPSTYETFEACLNTDPNAATSTTAAPSVVLVVSAMGSPAVLKATVEPPMTRSMKRKMMAASSSAVKPKKAKKNV